jgi:glycerol-3-phosphate dehydrogenase
MSILNAALTVFSPRPAETELRALETRAQRCKAELDSARSHANACRNGGGGGDDRPECYDPEIIATEREIHYLEAAEAFNAASPDRCAQRTFLVAELRSARDALTATEAEQHAPRLEAVTSEALAAHADAFQRLLSAKAEADAKRARRSPTARRCGRDFLASSTLIVEQRKARSLPLSRAILSHDGRTRLEVLGNAARHGKATVEAVDLVLRELSDPAPDGALYAARSKLKDLRERRERLVQLEAERKERGDAHTVEQTRRGLVS